MGATVVVNARFLGRPISGVERYALELTGRLGERITLMQPKRGGRGVGGHVWEQLALPRRLNGGVLWSPANTGPISVARQVLTLHDVAPLDHPEWFAPRFAAWYRWLLPRLVRRVARVVTVSAFSKARIVDRLECRPGKVTVIPNGVDARFRPDPDPGVDAVRRAHGIAGPYVLAVGSLEPRKNLRRLGEAWRDARRRLDGVALVVVGEGKPTLQSVPAPTDGGAAGVRYLGAVDDADLPALYAGAVACVLPSVYEGFGLPALEAMACETAVIASDAGALPEVVGDAAVRVDPYDAAAIADALTEVVRDDATRREHERRGRARAGRFSWDLAAERTWAVLAEVAA